MSCPWEDDVVVAQSVYHCSPTIGWSQNLLIGVHISHHQAPIAPATCWDCGYLFPARPQKGLSSTPPLPVTKRWLLACILALPLGRFPAWHCKPGGGKLFLKPMVGMSKWPTISNIQCQNATGLIWKSVLLQWSFSHPKPLAISDKFSNSSLVATVAILWLQKPQKITTGSVTRASIDQVLQ